ncbi:MAG: hypothetical protein V4709_11850 [Pseudomonadota bacterium]
MSKNLGQGGFQKAAWMAAVSLWLSACGGGGGEGVFATQTPGECAALQGLAGPGAGTAAGHAQPQRSDGAVTLSSSGGMVTARKLVTLVNDFGGATQAQVDLATPNGSVVACPRSGGGYGFKLMLESRAPTEADARRGLDSITVNHTDTLAANLLRLSTSVQFGSLSSTGGLPVGGSDGSNIQRTAAIVSGLPTSASYAISPNGANGAVRVSGLSGSSADLGTSNGPVSLDGRWDTATLNTDNGLLSVSGDYASLDATTANGPAEGDLQSSRNLDAAFTASNGSVDVKLRSASASAGFDLTADTSNGRTEISVPNTVAVGTQTSTSMHRQTSDYASRAVKAQVSASTSNGNVSIHD